MQPSRRTHLPPAGRDWLLPFYDPLVKLLGAAAARREVLGLAGVEPGHRVLDVGCGTGDLVVLLKRACPGAEVVGLDADRAALARARRKARREALRVQLVRGFSDALPYPDASFDRVLSTFMLHHLARDGRARTLREARRVLRPGGVLCVLDFGGPGRRTDSLLARLVHPDRAVGENFDGGLLALLHQSGFPDAREVAHRSTAVGRVGYYRASMSAL